MARTNYKITNNNNNRGPLLYGCSFKERFQRLFLTALQNFSVWTRLKVFNESAVNIILMCLGCEFCPQMHGKQLATTKKNGFIEGIREHNLCK